MTTTVLVFAGTILLLVGFHEAGHFLAAKVFGVYVIEFAIGFGPRLLSFRGKETRYTLRAIPFGGYVRMAGEDRRETDDVIPPERLLFGKPPWVRAVISLAGPLVNLLLAFAVTVIIVWAVSLPILQVADIIPETPAAETLAIGDRVLSVDGREIFLVDQLTDAIQRSEGNAIEIDLIRDGVEQTLHVTPDYDAEGERYVVGAYFASVARTNELVRVDFASDLAAAGLRGGDRIVRLGEEPIETYVDLSLALDASLPAAAVPVSVLRGGETVDLVLPTEGDVLDEWVEALEFADLGIDVHHTGFLGGLAIGSGQFALYVVMLGEVVGGIVTGRVAAGEAIQGPVGVARTLGEGFRLGPVYFFQLFAFLSLNFGLLNLIPFPGLDGSRVGFALYETIRGKPIPVEREGLIHAIGFAILIALMVAITFKDIVRLFG